MTSTATGRCPYCGRPVTTSAWAVLPCPACRKQVIAATSPAVGAPLVFLPVELVGWRITVPVAQGGMGRVFRGADIQDGRPVAIKFPLLEGPSVEAMRQRFEREVEILQGLRHPNVVGYLGRGIEASWPFVVMEWVEGNDLAALLAEARQRNQPLPIDLVARCLLQLTEALAALHNRSIIHRDVKPGNVIAAGSDHFKLVDLGIARFLENDPEAQTRASTVVGTRDYAAPELLAGRETDARTDLYSLGVLAFEMLTGRRPRDDRTRPSAVRPGVPGWLDDLVMRLCDVALDRRVQSTAELRALLQAPEGLRMAIAPLPPASVHQPPPPRIAPSPGEPPRLGQRPVRIAVFGARGAGKTSFFASLYGDPVLSGVAVNFPDESSRRHLKEVWRGLVEGKSTEATGVGPPRQLLVNLTVADQTWNLSTCDYSGRLVELVEGGRGPTDRPEQTLQERIEQWIHDSDAILIFLDVATRNDRQDSYLRDRKDELDHLFAALSALARKGPKIARPLALLLTKWDMAGDIKGNVEAERQRADAFISGRERLAQIVGDLKLNGSRVEVFPVSSFGGHSERNKPPAGGPRPFAVRAPLVWAAQQSDQAILEQTTAQAVAQLSPGRRWKGYSKAIRLYRDLIEKRGIKTGPIHAQINEELRPLEKAQVKRRRVIGQYLCGVGIVIALFLLLAGWFERGEKFAGANRAYESLVAFREQHPSDEYAEDRVERQERFLERWPRFSSAEQIHHVEHAAEEDRKARQRYREETALQALQAERGQLAGDEHAGKRLALLKKFPYPEGKYQNKLASWKAEDERGRGRFEEETDYRTHQERAMKSEKEKKYQDVAVVWVAYLRKYPHTARKADVDRRITDARAGVDNHEWNDVLAYADRNSDSHAEIIARARAYARKPGTRFVKEAEALAKRTEVAWDRSEYNKVFAASRERETSAGIEKCARAARKYLAGSHPRASKASAEVRKWLTWFEGLEKGKDFYITVKSLEIPAGSGLASRTLAEETRVYVSLNGTEYRTHGDRESWGRGRQPEYDIKLGPFRYQWGKKGTLRVKAEQYCRFTRNDWAEGEEKDSKFVLLKAHGKVVLTCAKDREIPVYLECPDAVPPTLPAYLNK